MRSIKRTKNGIKNTIKLAVHIAPRITEQDIVVLRVLLEKVRKTGMIIAEIGSFLGNGSTQTIIETVKEMNGTVYCIDTWKGTKNVEWHLKLAEEYNLFNTFLHYIREADGKDIVKPMMMESKDAGLIFKDQSCDFIFIDGDHSFEAVKEDIEIWKSKVKPGGILCGHDCEGSMSDFDHTVVNNNLNRDFINLDNFVFPGFHPGCVKAVDMAFRGNVTLWAHQDLSEHKIRGSSSIWHVVV